MIYINKKQFYGFVRDVLCVIAVIVFCVFIWKHSGITAGAKHNKVLYEVHTYEVEYHTSVENARIKEAVPKEVVYRYVER